MVDYKDVIEYIENRAKPALSFQYGGGPVQKAITLNNSQKRFVKNLVEGKITRVSRGFGKTTLIGMYADYLNDAHDTCVINKNYDESISGVADMINSKIMSKEFVLDALRHDTKGMMEEFNIDYNDVIDMLFDEIKELRDKIRLLKTIV